MAFRCTSQYFAGGLLFQRLATNPPATYGGGMQKSDGMNYAPESKNKPKPVVEPGEFRFAAMALDHGHIYGQSNGLTEAGGEVVAVWDPDPAKVEAYREKFPSAKAAASKEEILEDDSIQLVAAAAVPNLRGPLGCEVMKHGKDYFTDKTPFTTMEQLDEAKRVVSETGKKYGVYFSERLHVESAVYAGQLIEQGAIGDIVQVLGLGPHRLSKANRPDWFFNKEQYGGIITDIGSHHFEQFLAYSGATDAEVLHARVANYANPDKPELEDFGEASLLANNGVANYIRVDWFTPDGSTTWGDGRLFVIGTKGVIEARKYMDVATEYGPDQLYLTDADGEKRIDCQGVVGFPFFGAFILDCLNRTEKAMTQDHAFKAAELCLKAQAIADAGGLRPSE